jgi:hypothetical protein
LPKVLLATHHFCMPRKASIITKSDLKRIADMVKSNTGLCVEIRPDRAIRIFATDNSNKPSSATATTDDDLDAELETWKAKHHAKA